MRPFLLMAALCLPLLASCTGSPAAGDAASASPALAPMAGSEADALTPDTDTGDGSSARSGPTLGMSDGAMSGAGLGDGTMGGRGLGSSGW